MAQALVCGRRGAQRANSWPRRRPEHGADTPDTRRRSQTDTYTQTLQRQDHVLHNTEGSEDTNNTGQTIQEFYQQRVRSEL